MRRSSSAGSYPPTELRSTEESPPFEFRRTDSTKLFSGCAILALEVEAEVSTSRDVTDEYVDTTARLTNLLATEEALLKLFEKALKVEDALKVQTELTKIQGEMERLRGRIKFLEETSAFSLITVILELAAVEMPAGAGADQTISVGQAARFRASFMPPEGIDRFSFTWDFGDGSPVAFGERTAPSLREDTRFTSTITHVYSDDRDSPFIVEFEITGTGDAGLVEGSDTLIATVTKVPKIEVFAGESQIVEEGEDVKVAGSFTRPAGLTDLTFRWDFGDGSAPVTQEIGEGLTRAVATPRLPLTTGLSRSSRHLRSLARARPERSRLRTAYRFW